MSGRNMVEKTIEGDTLYNLVYDMMYKLNSKIDDNSSILKYIGNGVALARIHNKYPTVYDDLMNVNTVDELADVLMRVSKALMEIAGRALSPQNNDDRSTAHICSNSLKAISFLMTLLQTGEAVFEYYTDEKEETKEKPEETTNETGKSSEKTKENRENSSKNDTSKENKKASVKFKIEYKGELKPIVKMTSSQQVDIVRALISIIIIEASHFAVRRALKMGRDTYNQSGSTGNGNQSNSANSGGEN